MPNLKDTYKRHIL